MKNLIYKYSSIFSNRKAAERQKNAAYIMNI